jgi:phage gp37-like protein
VKIVSYRNDLIQGIKAFLPSLRTCELWDGKFDIGQLEGRSTVMPAVYVSVLGIPNSVDSGDGCLDTTLRIGVFVLTAEAHKLSKADASINIVEGLAGWLVKSNIYGAGYTTGVVSNIRAENLYVARDSEAKGATCWALTYDIIIRIGEADEPIVQVPTELYFSFAPATGAANADAYEPLTQEVP